MPSASQDLRIGAHLSIAGGLDCALRAAGRYGFPTVALFLRNQRQWAPPPLTDPQVRTFRAARRRLRIRPVLAHGSYLVNLAGRGNVRRKSLAALVEDLIRCRRLGIDYLVLHPGSRPDSTAGVRLVADALNAAVDRARPGRVKILLETTAGAGHSLGGRFEQLADILSRLRRPQRFGVCLDTCHVFAAGYDLRTAAAYRRTMQQFDAAVGRGRLLAVHVNDSRYPLGSRRDRHAHIGQGCIGRRGFAQLVNDPQMATLPLILETPKGTDARGRDWDAVNASVLRRLRR